MDIGVSKETIYKYFKIHGIEIHSHVRSRAEREINDWIKSLGIQTVTNNRNIIGSELDIYVPEFNVAIEYNGLYWHCELNKTDIEYHLKKTSSCEENDIRLIHIFEDEWEFQKEKCKETLLHIFNMSSKGIFARKLSIREIPWGIAKQFLDKYHLLNAGAPGNKRIGAYDKDDNLIGVMVFGRNSSENSTADEVELKRFVTNKQNNPGLGSKMFKYAVRTFGYDKVTAFVDRRWFTGLVKDHIGFEVIGYTKPALWRTDGKNRYHRRFITKSQLHDTFNDDTLTKREMMNMLGYFRIWDSGKIKLRWTIK